MAHEDQELLKNKQNIADIDKSGTINEEEFKKFLTKFDASITPDE